MREEGQIRALGDDELLAALIGLVQRDNELLAELLAHLAELDQRRLFLDLGFPSLHAYCTSALGMCESTAGRRITAARVCRKFPDVLARVAKGDLHLSAVCSMSPHLDWNNAPELIEICSNQSRRKVDEILAARFPRADVREKVRLDPLSQDRYGLHFTIDAEALEELERVRALARHRLPGGELSELFKLAMRTLRMDLEKQRFSAGKKKRARGTAVAPPSEGEGASTAPKPDMAEAAVAKHPPAEVTQEALAEPSQAEAAPEAVARRPSAEVAREVYARDEGQCTFVAQDGRRCSAREFVEFDHIQPRALGGEPTAANLRLRCRAHNQLYARQCYGDQHMATAVARARRRTAA
ncbi:MAG: hypothetical protein WDO69_28365 [Pseudomonadota bacterium]